LNIEHNLHMNNQVSKTVSGEWYRLRWARHSFEWYRLRRASSYY